MGQARLSRRKDRTSFVEYCSASFKVHPKNIRIVREYPKRMSSIVNVLAP
jgi:hypothetical protein